MGRRDYAGYAKTRRGELEHLHKGLIGGGEHLLFLHFIQIADHETGVIWCTSAHDIGQELKWVFSLKRIRQYLSSLEKGGYIKRFLVKGSRNPYPILINKYPLSDGSEVDSENTSNINNIARVVRSETGSERVTERGSQRGCQRVTKDIRIKNKEERRKNTNCGGTPRGEKKETKKPQKPKKKTTRKSHPDTRKVSDLFVQTYKAARGEKYPFSGAKDGKHLKIFMTESYDAFDKFQERLLWWFSEECKKFAEWLYNLPHTIATLNSNWANICDRYAAWQEKNYHQGKRRRQRFDAGKNGEPTLISEVLKEIYVHGCGNTQKWVREGAG